MKTKTTPPTTVDEYIAAFEPATQARLTQMREAIKKAAPNAEEMIAYMMPAYKQEGPLVYFGGFKNHVGFYATPTGHKVFEKELSIYKQGKGSVQFPSDKPLPVSLISKIVKFRVKQNLEKARLKKGK